MLTIYCGGDTKKAGEAFLGASKNAIKIDPDQLVGAELDEYARHKGLFDPVQVFAMRGMPDGDIALLAISPNNFFILLGELKATERKKLEKIGSKIEQYDLSACELATKVREEKENKNKSFRITDALTKRDKRSLWIEYWRAIYESADVEGIFWKLSWQVRAMLVSMRYGSASETDLHPYVYSKSRQGATIYGESELIRLSNNLLDIWSESHASGEGGKLALEQFILSV
ncbi:MAG TPA: hypothetical protein VJJ22_01205 [Candidatus Paceibacterota bacterium]